jgi:hypothetical protein
MGGKQPRRYDCELDKQPIDFRFWQIKDTLACVSQGYGYTVVSMPDHWEVSVFKKVRRNQHTFARQKRSDISQDPLTTDVHRF